MTQRDIKRIALITMIIDHIGSHIPGMPMWFRYIGRISAPLFLFCAAWGLYHTQSKEKYLIRLYVVSAIMSAGNVVVGLIKGGDYPENNIFLTIFLGALFVWLWGKWKWKGVIGFAAWQVILMIPSMFANLRPETIIGRTATDILGYMFWRIAGDIFAAEGGIVFVALFVIFYFTKEKPLHFTVYYFLYTLVIYQSSHSVLGMNYREFFYFFKFQYLMIFALPIMLAYNGLKGKGSKYFYYIFYPVHIWLLLLVEHFIS